MTGDEVDDVDAPLGRGVWRLTIVRVTAIVGVAALAIALVAGLWAAAWSEEQSTAVPGLDAPVDDPGPVTAPPVTTRPTPPAEEPEAPEPPAPEVLPPAPVVLTPADGALTKDPHPLFSGTGEPGFHVYVQLVDPATGRAWTIADVVAANDGSWQVRSATLLSDGRHDLIILQVDPDGRLSAAAHRSVVVDTTVQPPTITALAAEPFLLLPELTGTGEPGAVVTVRDDAGTALGTAGVASDGSWRLTVVDPRRDGAMLTATQTDAAGNVSTASAPTAPLVFERPAISVDDEVPSEGAATVVEVEISGVAGVVVEIAVDGTPTGQRVTLGSGPVAVSIPNLGDGEHRISVRYRDGSRVGSWAAATVTVVPTPPTPTPTPTPTPDPAPTSSPSPSMTDSDR